MGFAKKKYEKPIISLRKKKILINYYIYIKINYKNIFKKSKIKWIINIEILNSRNINY
jgi:hypothetical protein